MTTIKDTLKEFENIFNCTCQLEDDDYNSPAVTCPKHGLYFVKSVAFLTNALTAQAEGFKKLVEEKNKVDLNVEPSFVITAEYRLGEIRGRNLVLQELLEELPL